MSIRMKETLGKSKIFLLSVVAIIIMSFANENFLSYNNIKGLCESMMSYGIVALGLTVSLISGENNISIGSVLAFSGMVFGSLIEKVGILPAFLISIAFYIFCR